jgi:hypothetical protein
VSAFNQPLCSACYEDRHPGRDPVVLLDPERETCCICGDPTSEGIYERIDPRTVKYPKYDAP